MEKKYSYSGHYVESPNMQSSIPKTCCTLSKNIATLDNPQILDQQLEALAHRKKQLEKKGLLQNQHDQKNNLQPLLTSHHPKFPIFKDSASDMMETFYINSTVLKNRPRPYGTDELLQIDISSNNPTCKNRANTLCSLSSRNEIVLNKDRYSSPPSPVSSSYSELRQATHYAKNIQSTTKTKNERHPELQNFLREYLTESFELQPSDTCKVGQEEITKKLMINGTCGSIYYGLRSTSQASSTYESIYEPINPRSCNTPVGDENTFFREYANCLLVKSTRDCESRAAGDSSVTGRKSLSSLTIQNENNDNNTGIVDKNLAHIKEPCNNETDSSNCENDTESYGICEQCQREVVGENSGCTAMNRVYHIECFTCARCQINLQGKPFYCIESKPYCEYDYQQTLEKCSVCMKPILERILRATGKPYHPQCFTCVVCKNSLDGVPFTVDAINQNYCIEDFHKKFAPRCCVCHDPIMPEPGQEETVRVVALDRSFHFRCYKCEDCGLLLSSEAEGCGCYPLDDHVLCKSCNAERVKAMTNGITREF